MRIALAVLGLTALLTGCQTGYHRAGESSPYYAVPAGSRLTLHEPLAVPPDRRSIYIQAGRVVPGGDVRQHYPFCRFELYSLSAGARTVSPDTMVVTQAAQEETTHGASAGAGMLHLAQLPSGASAMPNEPGGPSILALSTRLALRSERQPDIYRLTCTHWGFPGLDRHLSIADIRRTLAPLFTLHLPAVSAPS